MVDAVAVARAWGLGTPSAPPRRLDGRSRVGVWALTTERGDWIIKSTAHLTDDAIRLEREARRAGVATAPPVPVPPGASDVRVWSKVDGVAPTIPADESLATWLGRSIATMAGLGLTSASTVDSEVLCHRDINRHNIVVTRDGPVLLDFDNAGPQRPWWELVHHAFLLACHDLGPEEPDPTTVRAAVRAYREAGGEPGPADRTAFAGLLAGLEHWTREHPVEAAPRLPLITRSLDRWSALLR
jgi:hypothetical protein